MCFLCLLCSLFMRIISGKFKSRRLKGTPPPGLRPTSDKLRETVFNILGPRVDGATFLDGCAGMGAIGIEAISRGAAFVYFVEQSRKACQMIRENLNSLDVQEGSNLLEMDLIKALDTMESPVRHRVYRSAVRSRDLYDAIADGTFSGRSPDPRAFEAKRCLRNPPEDCKKSDPLCKVMLHWHSIRGRICDHRNLSGVLRPFDIRPCRCCRAQRPALSISVIVSILTTRRKRRCSPWKNALKSCARS